MPDDHVIEDHVRWRAEDLRVVKEPGRPARLEVWDAHGEWSPWWTPAELAGRDAVELRRLLDRVIAVLAREGA